MKKMCLVAVGGVLVASLMSGCGTVPPSPQKAETSFKAAGDLRYSNKWRIEVSEGANSDGVFVFHVTPYDEPTQVVTVKVDDGESEDRVARTIKNAFEDQLDTGKYDIEMDDGEDVLIKKDLTEADFALQIISSTVQSVRLKIERE